MHRNGQAGAKDHAEGRKWFRLAADKGLAEAQLNLGVMCELGEGAPRDLREAHHWFRKAADQGNAGAQFNLAVLYERGLNVSEDHGEAARWYRKAADQGDPAAQLNLGTLYYHGRGVLQDYVESHKWLNLASARFLPGDSDKRARALKNRDLVARKMTPSQIADAQLLARDWKPRVDSETAAPDRRGEVPLAPPIREPIRFAVTSVDDAGPWRGPRWMPG